VGVARLPGESGVYVSVLAAVISGVAVRAEIR
jgi:hypothetical protein